MKKDQIPVRDFCTREEFEADPARFLNVATRKPVTITDANGKFFLRFEEGVKQPVKDWAMRPGQLEDDDVL